MRDHYETLGLEPEASEPEIKAAYRSLVRSLHPDLRSGGEGGATDRLLEVQRAYEILSHPGRRASYDAGLPEGMESMLRDGGAAEALAEVLTAVREDAAANGRAHEMEPGARAGAGARHRSRGAPEPAVGPAPELPTPTGDRTFLTAVGASVVLAAVAGALALWAVAGAAGPVDLLSFLLMTLLAPVLALLASWVLSYADGKLDEILCRAARRLRAARNAVRLPPSTPPPGGDVLRLLVLLAASGVYALVGTAPEAFVLALLCGVGFSLLHRVHMKPGPRRLLVVFNLLIALGGLGLAGAAWHGSEVAAVAAAAAGGDTAAELVRRAMGLVGTLLVTVVLYVSADLWHDLADRTAWVGRVPAGTGRRVLLFAGPAITPVAGALALLLEGLAAVVRTCSVPGTLIRRAVGGGWL